MHSADTARAPGGAGDTQRWCRPSALMAADVMALLLFWSVIVFAFVCFFHLCSHINFQT